MGETNRQYLRLKGMLIPIAVLSSAIAAKESQAQHQPSSNRADRPAGAQPVNTRASTVPRSSTSGGPMLTPVDQGIADLSPLSVSTRVIPRDLRTPTGFDRLFLIAPGASFRGNASGQSQFARMNGGITATFPQSSYLETQLGAIPQVSANTVYWIGNPFRQPWDFDPLAAARAKADTPRVSDAGARPVSLSAASNGPSGTPSQGTSGSEQQVSNLPDAAAAPSVWTNDEFRRDLIQRLLTKRNSR